MIALNYEAYGHLKKDMHALRHTFFITLTVSAGNVIWLKVDSKVRVKVEGVMIQGVSFDRGIVGLETGPSTEPL